MKDKIVEILKLYEDPAEDLNHNLYDTIAEEIDALYSAGSEVSDEEIEKEALRRNKDDYPDELGYGTDAFENGAKWMRSKLTHQPVSEEEIEDLYNKHLTTVNTGIHLEDQMLLNNFKAAIKELLNR